MNKIIIAVIIIVVVVFGGYFAFKSGYQQPASPVSQLQNNETLAEQPIEQPLIEQAPSVTENVITYTDSGYSPSTITIKAGETVTWKNESSNGMWIASGMHPTHMLYSGTSLSEHCPDTANTSFDECTSAQPGESWLFTFEKKGTWGYHNHVKIGSFGKIIVE